MMLSQLEINSKFMLRKGGRIYVFLGYSSCFFFFSYGGNKLYYCRDGHRKVIYLGN